MLCRRRAQIFKDFEAIYELVEGRCALLTSPREVSARL